MLDLSDNGYWIPRTGYNQHSPLARLVYQTEATIVDIDVWMNGTPDTSTAIAIKVNGQPYACPLVTSSGASTIIQSLPAGMKRVEIVAGVQAIPASNPLGVFLVDAQFNQEAEWIPPTVNNRLVVYGDSNASGGGGNPNVAIAWPELLRGHTQRSVVSEALSGRSLHDDTNTSALRSAFVARVAELNPAEMWIAVGTNDYGGSKWSAASYGIAYGLLLDDLHTALPYLKIYCQSPINRVVETANASGSTLQDYRDQVRTLAHARSYCQYVDGLRIVGLSDLRSDGIHLTDAGGQRYAQFVLNYRGDEYIEASVTSANAIPLMTAQFATLTSIRLPAGEWDVSALTEFQCGSGTVVSLLLANLALAPGIDITPGRLSTLTFGAAGMAQINMLDISVINPAYRFSLDSPRDVYLNVRGTFTASTLKAWGLLHARKVR